jgi:20S proteasome alpha/beta subunit
VTLIVGLKCSDGIVLAAEEEEASGFAAKRKVKKVKLYSDENWTLAFAGAGDAAIIDNAERELGKWLDKRDSFTSDHLSDAIDGVLASVYTKYVDTDPKSDGIVLIIGASCDDGLHLIPTVKRTPHFQDSKTCARYGADIAYYLLDRIHSGEDDWLSGVKVAAFAMEEAKESSQFCGGDTQILVLQSPPNPRWRDLGWGGPNDLETSFALLVSTSLRNGILGVPFTPEVCEEYCDEHCPTPYEFDPDDPNSLAENLRRSGLRTSEGQQ